MRRNDTILIVFLIIDWPNIPNKIASHYNALGTPDAWSSKESIVTMPVVNFGLYVLLTVISFFPKLWNIPVEITNENYLFIYKNMRSMLSFLKLIIVATFTYISICDATGRPLGGFFLILFLVLLFGVMIYYIRKISKSQKQVK
jgi:uncharacterized membrane protein